MVSAYGELMMCSAKTIKRARIGSDPAPRRVWAFVRWLLVLVLVVMPSLMLSAQAQVQAPDPLATLDRTTVVEGAELTLRVRTRQTNHELDLAPLLRDFEVVSQAHSTNNPALTGQGRDFLEWEIVLVPRRTGDLTIPPLSVGGQQTQPIEVRVLTISPEQRAVTEQHVALDVDIERTELYLGEPTIVTLTLYYNVNVNGTFADVTPDDSEWAALGDGSAGTTQADDGREFNYTRFKYLYTPLSVGPRELPAFEFEGTYRTHSLSPRQRLQDVTSQPIALTINPVPDAFPDGFSWLPANNVELSERWSTDATSLASGEQVQRTLIMRAEGPAAVNLPAVLDRTSAPEGVRTYPDRARSDERLNDERRQSSRTESESYLFLTGGRVEMPAVRVPWWDLAADELRWAELPSRGFEIATPLVTPDLDDDAALTGQETDREGFNLLALLRYGILAVIIAATAYLLRGPLKQLLSLVRRRFGRVNTDSAAADPQPGTGSPPSNRGATPHEPRSKPWRRQKIERPDWLTTAEVAVTAEDWPDLLKVLARALGDQGWPDLGAVEAHWGVAGFRDLVKRTQQVVYGAPTTSVDTLALAQDWQALLNDWPHQPATASRQNSKGQPKALYPD